jgi:DNA-binding CsgD family transcriptional regulator
MGLTKGPELKAKILEIYQQDRNLSAPKIAQQLGIATSTVHYHLTREKTRGRGQGWNHIDANVEKHIRNLSIRGLRVVDIAKQAGVSTATVYRVRSEQSPTGQIVATRIMQGRAFGEKVAAMKASGMKTIEIAKQLHKARGTIYSALHYYKKRQEKGVLEIQHGNHNGSTNDNASTSTTATEAATTAPSKAELIGYTWAHVERVITDIGQRTQIAPNILARRLSELLAYTSMR